MRAYVGSPITARIEEDVRSDVGSRQSCHPSPYLGPTLRPWWRAGRCGLWVEALPGELADRCPPLHRARVAMALAKLGTTDAWTEMQPPRPAHHAGQQRRLRPRQLGPRRDLARRPPPPRPADPPVPDQTAAYRLPATTTPRQRPRPARPCARRHHRPSPVTLARSAASACVLGSLHRRRHLPTPETSTPSTPTAPPTGPTPPTASTATDPTPGRPPTNQSTSKSKRARSCSTPTHCSCCPTCFIAGRPTRKSASRAPSPSRSRCGTSAPPSDEAVRAARTRLSTEA
jgi:hypothetical protein